MDTKNLMITLLGVFFVMTVTIPTKVKAAESDQINDPQNETVNNNAAPFYEGRYNWQREENERATNDNIKFLNQKTADLKNNPKQYQPKLSSENDFKNRLMNEIPYGENLKHMWDVVDGDVDLHFTGLRADRRNRGLSYTTNYIPLMGDVDGIEMKFDAGKTNEFSLKSNITPFVGKVKGLSVRGSTTNEDSKVSARYTIALD